MLSSGYDIAQRICPSALQRRNQLFDQTRRSQQQPTVDVFLVVCGLFACFEVLFSDMEAFLDAMTQMVVVRSNLPMSSQSLRGPHKSALSHVKSGVKIISPI